MTGSLNASDPIPGLFADRRFLALLSGQIFTQVGGNALLFALTFEITSRTGSATAIGAMFWAFLIPTVIVAIPAGVLVDRSDARRVLLAANVVRAVLIAAMAVAIMTSAPTATLYGLVVPVAIATAFFAPAELAMIPRLVASARLVPANALFTLTLNASFAVGFALVGPYVLFLSGERAAPLVVVVAALYLVATVFCLRLPNVPSTLPASGAVALGAIATTRAQLIEAIALLRHTPAMRWAMEYLVLSGVLIGVLAVLGPGYAIGLGISSSAFGLVILPLGLGVVATTALLDRLIGLAGERRVVHIGLGGLALAMAGMGALSLIHGAGAGGGSPAPSTLLLVATITALAGAAYAAVAIPSQAALSRQVPDAVRGRIFGALNMFVSLGSVAPTIIIAPAADAFGSAPVLLVLSVLLVGALSASIYVRRAEIWRRGPAGDTGPLFGLAGGGAGLDVAEHERPHVSIDGARR